MDHDKEVQDGGGGRVKAGVLERGSIFIISSCMNIKLYSLINAHCSR
jgi:hypothetical protein